MCDLYTKIEKLCKKRKIKISDLSRKTGITKTCFSESNQNESPENIRVSGLFALFFVLLFCVKINQKFQNKSKMQVKCKSVFCYFLTSSKKIEKMQKNLKKSIDIAHSVCYNRIVTKRD